MTSPSRKSSIVWPVDVLEVLDCSRAEAPGLESESDYAHEYCEERRTCDKTAAPRMSIKGHCNLFGEEQIRRAVDQVGPVSLGINATMPEYQHYRGGIISSRSCGHKRTNHAVLAVGYGEKNGVKFWLIRNSYGPQWGEDGHFKIERGANMCGVETFANYPVLN
ncbi:hypothetical protein QR680_006515 [Steinernema hermaphroditum]|uniref:Peptidase C1A papain C-terminal domain-containing protein n=1 Tax=Steinernema hermaphroditum TaxID=289476 RepID=A0AA39LXK6_9BILA|nr:hypothetical protein QR680_006515 [Steinernema hermaphroditum]